MLAQSEHTSHASQCYPSLKPRRNHAALFQKVPLSIDTALTLDASGNQLWVADSLFRCGSTTLSGNAYAITEFKVAADRLSYTRQGPSGTGESRTQGLLVFHILQAPYDTGT